MRELLRARGLAVGYHDQGQGGRAQRREKGRASRGADRSILSGLELSLPAGRLVALLGPNGSGKSTLLRSLAGLQAPLAGRIELGGRDLAQLDLEARAALVSIVLTERFDSGWFNVFDIVAFGRYPHTGIRNELGRADRAVVEEAIAAVGLSGFEARLFSELSDGERQKALIARAMAQETPLMVLDEPTAFLDAPSRHEVFHLVRALAGRGQGLLMSTHEVDLALREADEIWLIDRERGLLRGSPEELVLSGAIAAAFAGPRLAFEAESARFIAPHEEGARLPLRLEGPPSLALSWTGRMAERLGFDAANPTEAPSLELRVGQGPAGENLWWFRRDGGEELCLSSLTEVEAALRSAGAGPARSGGTGERTFPD